MSSVETDLPIELRPENYPYPTDLLRDHDRILRFDGSDDIHIDVPLSAHERTLFMAQYAVADALRLVSTEETKINIIRGETKGSFM